MPTVSYWSDDFVLVNGVPADNGTLLGSAAGDGSELLGATLNISADIPLVTFETDDPDGRFEDDDSSQTMTDTSGTPYSSGTAFEIEYSLVLQDPGTGLTYTIHAVSIGGDPENITGFTFTGDVPPLDTNLTVISSGEGPTGTDAPLYDDLVTTLCFASGSWIDTPNGARLIDDLAEGDLVLTRDHGAQPIVWKGSTTLAAETLAQHPELAPVQIKAGAFGPGCPAADLTVSPDHRVLVEDWRASLVSGAPEVLASARLLVNDGTVQRKRGARGGVTYVHIAFKAHEIISSTGCWSESLQPLAPVVDAMQARAREELLSLFPQLRSGEIGRFAAPARPVLTEAEFSLLR